MKRERWLLLVIILLAFGLRCLRIAERSIQYDDAFTILLAQQSVDEILSGTAADTMPPLYYLILHFWMALGQSIWLYRLPTIFLGVGSVWMMYALTREVAGVKAGLWAALLTAISPLQYYHSQDIRMYALLGFTQLGYAWCFARLVSGKRSWKEWVGLIAFGTAAMYTHNLAIFGLVAADFYLLVKRDWHLLGKLILAQLGIALLDLPWLVMIPGQVQKIQTAFWIARPGLVEVVQALMTAITDLPLPGIWLGVGLGLTIWILIIGAWSWFKDRPAGTGLLACFCFLPPALLFILSYFMRPIFLPRGFIGALLIFLGLNAVIIAGGRLKGAAQGMVVAWLAAAVIGLSVQVNFNEFPRPPFEQAMRELSATLRPGELVVHDNKLSAFPCEVYAPEVEQAFVGDEPGSPSDNLALASQQALDMYAEPDLETAVAGHDRIVYIVFQEAVDEYIEAGMDDHPGLTWMRENYTQVSEQDFNGLLVFRFSR